MTGAELIAQERQRQVEVEGWTPEHDDKHNMCEMGMAAEHFKASKYSGLTSLDFRPITLLDNLRYAYPNIPLMCLGYRGDGHPRHPLMLSYDTGRESFIWHLDRTSTASAATAR